MDIHAPFISVTFYSIHTASEAQKLPIKWVPEFYFPGKSKKLTTNIHTVLKLTMHRPIHPFPLKSLLVLTHAKGQLYHLLVYDIKELRQLNWFSNRLRAGLKGFYSRQMSDFSLLHSIQSNLRAHSAFYLIGNSGNFHGVKWPWHEANHLPPPGTEVKNGGATTPVSYVFMAQCLID
jgi:hypothetical protein